MYTKGNVTVKRMLILDDLLTDLIRETQEYKDYVKEFIRFSRRRKGNVLLERQVHPDHLSRSVLGSKNLTTSIPPPSDDRERYKTHKATLLSVTMHKTTKAVEEQENVAIVQEKLLE
ncbi:hypothetical protein Tco_0306783, partial [Tanacetum coccineum]